MILVALAVGVSLVLIRWYRAWKVQCARERLVRQFRVSLQSMVYALRIGIGLTQAIEFASQEGEEPMMSHWRWIVQGLQVGKPMSDVLDQFPQQLDLREAHWFATAVQVTQSTGASLAEVLETLAGVLQEQENLREKVSALTAQGKASGVLLGILPFGVLAAMFVVAPEMAAPMFSTLKGQALLCLMTVMITAGGWVIRKIVTVQVD